MNSYSDEIVEQLLVAENGKKYAIDLDERLIKFSVEIIKMLQILPYKKEYDVFRHQLSKSATSIGANFQEAYS